MTNDLLSPANFHPVARLPGDWAQHLAAQGERAFAAKQVFTWIQKHAVLDPAKMTNLSARLKASLADEGLAPDLCAPETLHRSEDGTRKITLRLRDGALIETVLLPGSRATEDADAASADLDEDGDTEPSPTLPTVRVTQCISTQVGCAMGCAFCASGIAGLKRNLGPEEIVAQVLVGRSLCDEGEDVRNVVYMGMGEPLANYDATARSLRLLTHPDGIGLSTRRVTVSTSGLVPEIARMGEEFGGQVALAVSLHAGDDETRSALMPINRKYPLREVISALRAYPMPKRRRITIEYTLVGGVNDDEAMARKVARVLQRIPVKINLIPMNPVAASSLRAPEAGRVFAFQRVLTEAGYTCFIRRRRGDDVAAACGQLVLIGAKAKVKGFRQE